MSAEVDRAWLEWARPIVRISEDDRDHFEWCEARLNRAAERYTDVDQSLRWPGYVGSNWQPGRGVLFVGSVHADFRGSPRDAGYEERMPILNLMAKANADWRAATTPTTTQDLQYLESTRSAYTTLMPYWRRAATFRAFIANLFEDQQDPFSHASWTNLAHCRSRPREIPERNLQLRCSSEKRDYPISDLVRCLWPAAILVSVLGVATVDAHRYDVCADRYASERPAGYDGPLVRVFSGTGAEVWQGNAVEVWTRELRDELRTLWRG